MKEKIIKFTRDWERISDLAYERRDKEDYVGALSSLHYEDRKYKDPEVIAQIADVYTQMNMFETAISYWYKYLRYSSERYYCEAYNALGANYYFLNNDDLAGYYFNKQIKTGVTDEMVFSSVLEDYYLELQEQKRDMYKLAYPKKQIDIDDDNLFDGKVLIAENRFAEAIEKFNLIGRNSELYFETLVEKAYAEFNLGENERAVSDVDLAIKNGEVSVHSLNLAINICSRLGDIDGIAEYIEILKVYEGDGDENYRKINLLCDLGLYDDALALIKEKKFDISYTANAYYISAVLTFNNGDISAASDMMRNAYIITGSPVAKYYLRYMEKVLRGKENFEKISLSFDLPEKESERRISIIKKVFSSIGKRESEVTASEFGEIAEWAFKATNERSIQLAAAIIIIAYKMKKLMPVIEDALIDPSVSDDVKYRIISFLCEQGFTGKYCVVYGGIFKKIQLKIPQIEGEYADLFVKAYAYAFGRMSMVSDDCKKLLSATVRLFEKAQKSKIVIGSDDIIPLGCAIYITSGMVGFRQPDFEYKYFDANKKSVQRILNELNGEEDDRY